MAVAGLALPDQEAVGRKVRLPFSSSTLTCRVRALFEWLERGGIVRGPIFRPATSSDSD